MTVWNQIRTRRSKTWTAHQQYVLNKYNNKCELKHCAIERDILHKTSEKDLRKAGVKRGATLNRKGIA